MPRGKGMTEIKAVTGVCRFCYQTRVLDGSADMTEEDLKYKEAVRAFYLVYKSLKRKRALRYHFHADTKSARMKVWEYTNDGGIKTICRVKAENSTDCHRIAAEQLRWEEQKESTCIR